MYFQYRSQKKNHFNLKPNYPPKKFMLNFNWPSSPQTVGITLITDEPVVGCDDGGGDVAGTLSLFLSL